MDEEAVQVEGGAVGEAPIVASPGPRVAEAPPASVAHARWAPRPIPLGTVKAAATLAACILATIGMCVGDARARGERIARAPVVVPSVAAEARPMPLLVPKAAPSPTALPCFGCLMGEPPPRSPSKVGGGGRAATPMVHAVGLPTVVGGPLPPEVVSRSVRQNHGRFRLCYEAGLRTRRDLVGRVSVTFVIGRDGTVSTASASTESTLPDQGVVACVTRAFGGLSFPPPETGIATVVYRLAFTVE